MGTLSRSTTGFPPLNLRVAGVRCCVMIPAGLQPLIGSHNKSPVFFLIVRRASGILLKTVQGLLQSTAIKISRCNVGSVGRDRLPSLNHTGNCVGSILGIGFGLNVNNSDEQSLLSPAGDRMALPAQKVSLPLQRQILPVHGSLIAASVLNIETGRLCSHLSGLVQVDRRPAATCCVHRVESVSQSVCQAQTCTPVRPITIHTR